MLTVWRCRWFKRATRGRCRARVLCAWPMVCAAPLAGEEAHGHLVWCLRPTSVGNLGPAACAPRENLHCQGPPVYISAIGCIWKTGSAGARCNLRGTGQHNHDGHP